MTRLSTVISAFLAIADLCAAQDAPIDAGVREKQCPRNARVYCGEWKVHKVNYSDNEQLNAQGRTQAQVEEV
jgi:transcription initiation factor TFIID subunit TAF12